VIYFIQDSSTLHIKIGFTGGDVEGRLKQLQTGSAAVLVALAHVGGGKDVESLLHQRLAPSRERGEWFRPTAEVLEIMLGALGARMLASHRGGGEEGWFLHLLELGPRPAPPPVVPEPGMLAGCAVGMT